MLKISLKKVTFIIEEKKILGFLTSESQWRLLDEQTRCRDSAAKSLP